MPLDADQLKSIRREHPDRIPVSVGILPATWRKYRERMDDLLRRHPDLFPGHQPGGHDYDALWTETYRAGEHVDAWGCVWSNVHEGMEAIVTGHPLPDRGDIRRLKAPTVDAGLPHGFMFLRLTDLRGFEEAMLDFAEEPPELQRMIDVVRDYNIRQVGLVLARMGPPPDMVAFGDDLGMQQALPISPAKWRQYLKPAFAAIYAPVKAAGYYVFMHTDGCVWEIADDLADVGVDVLNPQFRANGMDRLRDIVRKGRMTVKLDLDRQRFPFATPAQLDRHVADCVRELADSAGGLWLYAEIGPDVPLENADALFAALARHTQRPARGPSRSEA